MQFGSSVIILFLLTQLRPNLGEVSACYFVSMFVHAFLDQCCHVVFIWSLLMCDFDLVYVANHSHTDCRGIIGYLRFGGMKGLICYGYGY